MKFKPISLFAVILVVFMTLNITTVAAIDERQVTITNIVMSANTDPSHPGTLLTDGDLESYWAVKPGSGDGWVELSLNQPALIYGLQLNGNLSEGSRLSVEYQHNGFWLPFLGGSIQTIPAQGIIDLSYDRIVTDRLRLRLTNPDNGSRMAEIKVLGQAATSVFHLIEPVEIKYSKDSYRTAPSKFLVDRNTYTSWRTCHDDGDDDSDELGDNPIFKADAFHHRRIRQIRTEDSRQVELELDGSYRLNNINLYITSYSQGSITVKTKSGHKWQTVGQITLTGQAGWQRVDLSQKQIDSDRILIQFEERQNHGRGRSDHSKRSGGIGEVEIWGYGAYSGARHQTLVSVPQPVNQALNYSFTIEEDGLTDNRLELAVAGEHAHPVTVELNGIPVKLQPTLKINGNTVYQYSIPETDLWEGENFIRVLPGNQALTLLQLQVSEGLIDAEVPFTIGGLNDGLRLTPAEGNGSDFSLVRERFIEAVEIYAPSNLAATVSAKTGTGLTQLTQTETGDGYLYFQGGVSATGLNIINHTGVPFAEIRVLASADTDGAPEVKIIWPKSLDRPGKEIPECDDDDKEYVLGRIDNPEAQVFINDKPAWQSGHYFWIRFNELGLKFGEINAITVKALDPAGRESSKQMEFFWGDTPEYRIDQKDIIYYTNKTTFTISGQVGSRQYEILVDEKAVSVDQRRRFSTVVTLEEGFNLIPITFHYTDKGREMQYTVYRRVVCESSAPKLYIDAPVSGTYFNTANVTVTGTVSGKNPTVRVNGLRASVENGWFRSLPVRLIEGKNTIKVEATDDYGRKTIGEVIVYKDTKAPIISEVTPSNGYLSNSAEITVNGKVSDISQAYVYVNGKFAPCLNGGFTTTITLVEGENHVKVTAIDQAGNSQVYLFKVTVDTIAPIEFTPTANPAGWTNNNRPAISFATTDATSGVDHYEIRVGNGSWITPVVSPYRFVTAIPDGEQTVQAKAVDRAGNAAVGEVKIYIDTVPPAVPTKFEVISGIERAELRWEDPQGEVRGYRIIRTPVFPDANFKDIFRMTENDKINRYVDPDLVSGADYSYTIQAIDRAGNYSVKTDQLRIKVGETAQEIGSNGGAVKFDNCEITLVKDAISEPGRIILRQTSEALPENEYGIKMGPAYSFTLLDQSGKEVTEAFNKPALLTVSYAEFAIPEGFGVEDLGIYWYNKNGEYWERLEYARIDPETKTIDVPLFHFSDYQVMASQYTAPVLDSYYELGVSPYQSYFQNNLETVSLEYGGLTVCATDLRLPGPGGFDLVIKRIYDSGAAQQQRIMEIKKEKSPIDTFGCGWSLNIPWIETNPSGKFLRLPEGQTIKIKFDSKRLFKYHKGIHFSLEYRSSNPRYLLTMKDGTQYHFNKDGKATKQIDPSGLHSIEYSYNNRQISAITDSTDRAVNFHYKQVGSKWVIDQISIGPDSNDQRTIIYGYNHESGKDLLTDVYDPLNRHTVYGYEPHEDLMTVSQNYIGGTSRKKYDLELLNSITYPTGAVSSYQYEIKKQATKNDGYCGDKILVLKHTLPSKVVSYSYELNPRYDSSSSDYGRYSIPSNKYIWSCNVTESGVGNEDSPNNKVVALEFNQICGNLLADGIEKYVDLVSYEGTLPVSSRTLVKKDKEYERVDYEYDMAIRAVNRERHYRNDDLKYSIISTYDSWGNMFSRFDNSRNLREEWTYHALKSTVPNHYNLDNSRIRNLVATAIKLNVNPLNGTETEVKVSYQYDEELGKPLTMTVNDGQQDLKTSFTYYSAQDGNPNAVGLLKTRTEPNGLISEFTYDGNSFPASKVATNVLDADGNPITTKFSFNWWGLKESETNPNGFTTYYQYDKLNRVTRVGLPDDDQVGTNNPYRKYDFYDDPAKPKFNTCEFFNEKGQQTTFKFDGLGRLTEVIKLTDGSRYKAEVSTKYGYDPLGRIERVTDAKDQVTTYSYDGLNRVVRVTYPDNSFVTLDYNDLSNTVTITDEEGGVVTERSDWANRLVEAKQYYQYINNGVTEDDIYTWTFAYDSFGNKLQQMDPMLQPMDQEYDPLGRLMKTILPTADLQLPGGIGSTSHRPMLKYEYDQMGNKIGEYSSNVNASGDPEKYKTMYEYDLLGRLIKVTTKATEMVNDASVIKTYITQHFYDAAGNRDRTILPNGKELKYEYSARGWLVSETAPYDPTDLSTLQTTHYRYDVLGNRIAVIDPRNKTVEENEGSWHTAQIVDEIKKYQDRDPRSDKTFTTWYVYDDLNRLYRTVLPDNSPPANPYLNPEYNPYTEITYDAVGNKTAERDANGVEIRYEYTVRNWLWKVKDIKDGREREQKTYGYDKSGRVKTVTDVNLKTVVSDYDSLGRLRKVTDPLLKHEEYEYDKVGNRTKVTDARGNATIYVYNSLGWLTGVKQPLGNFSQYRYDPNGNLVETIAPNNLSTRAKYDELNRVVESIDPLENSTFYGYDEVGNRSWMKDRRGTKWEYQYYANNLLRGVKATGVDETSYWVNYDYDKTGNRIEVKDSGKSEIYYNLDVKGNYQEDPLNRINYIDRSFDGASYRTEYTYNSAGLITEIKYPEALSNVIYEYNDLNQLDTVTGFTDPNGITYKDDGSLAGINYANGATAVYNYDANRRLDDMLVTIGEQNLLNLDYEYDNVGNITVVKDIKVNKDNTITVTEKQYEYDKNNQLTKAVTPGTFMETDLTPGTAALKTGDVVGNGVFEFTPILSGLMGLDYHASSIGIDFGSIAPAVKVIELVPDKNYTTHRINENTIGLYESRDNINYILIPKTGWEYQKDSKGIVTLTLKEKLATRYLKLHVKYDERGRDFKPVNNATFLNEIARMLRVYQEATARTEEYQYDAAGNRKLLKVSLVRTAEFRSQYYNNSDRLKTDGKYAFAYDNAGNMVKKGNTFVISDDTVSFTTKGEDVEYWEYKYDLLNRLIEVTKNNNDDMIILSKYAYDPEGFRVVKYQFVNGTQSDKTHYVFQGTEPIFEKRISDGRIKSYIYALGKHLARVDGKIGDDQAKKYWYVTDHVGSIRAVTDKDGKKVWSADYLAFGKQFDKSADTDFEELHSFTGKEYDPDTGLHYYNARWYDADLGRFISEDPVADPNNPNLYSYGANNPLRFIDPRGLYGYDSQTGQISHPDGTITDTSGNVISTPPGGSNAGYYYGGSNSSSSEATSTTKSNDKQGGSTETSWDKDSKKVSETIFDKDGNLKGTKYYSPDGKLQLEYSYKKDGTIGSITGYNPDGSSLTVTFDRNGNVKSVDLTTSWEQRWKDVRDIKDEKARKEEQGRLLGELFPGFKYDATKPTPLITQLEAWKNRDVHEKIGITVGLLGYHFSFQYNITTGTYEISKAFSPTSFGGISFDYEIGKDSTISTEYGLSDYFGLGASWDFNDRGGMDLKGFSINIGIGLSTPLNVTIDIPEEARPFPGI